VHTHEIKPIWSSASFLVYTGGLTVLVSAIAALAYLSGNYESGAEAAWALLVLVVLYAIAHAFRIRERPLAAGIFAFASVIAWGAFVALLFTWFGWNGVSGSFHNWSWSRLALWLLILAAAQDDHRRFRFPLIRLITVVVTWLFVIDLLSSGGSWTAVLTLLVGLVYLAAGTAGTGPSAFWLHVVAGLLIGGSLLYFLHSSDVEWAFLGAFAALFIVLGSRLHRSSWAVIGTLGLFVVASHYATVWTEPHGPSGFTQYPPPATGSGFENVPVIGVVEPSRAWAPIVTFAVLGFLLVAFGLLARHRNAPVAASPSE
jgi:hypothetical protein